MYQLVHNKGRRRNPMTRSRILAIAGVVTIATISAIALFASCSYGIMLLL
jgi:hypothetical protein